MLRDFLKRGNFNDLIYVLNGGCKIENHRSANNRFLIIKYILNNSRNF